MIRKLTEIQTVSKQLCVKISEIIRSHDDSISITDLFIRELKFGSAGTITLSITIKTQYGIRSVSTTSYIIHDALSHHFEVVYFKDDRELDKKIGLHYFELSPKDEVNLEEKQAIVIR